MAIGVYTARRNRSADAYFLANRSMPGWIVGFSLMATIISSMTFLAIPGFTFEKDWRYMPAHFFYFIPAIVAYFPVHALFSPGPRALGIRVPGAAVRHLGPAVCRHRLSGVSNVSHRCDSLRRLSALWAHDRPSLGLGHPGAGHSGGRLHHRRRPGSCHLHRPASGPGPDCRWTHLYSAGCRPHSGWAVPGLCRSGSRRKIRSRQHGLGLGRSNRLGAHPGLPVHLFPTALHRPERRSTLHCHEDRPGMPSWGWSCQPS